MSEGDSRSHCPRHWCLYWCIFSRLRSGGRRAWKGLCFGEEPNVCVDCQVDFSTTSEEIQDFRKFWAQAGVEERVELLEGPALLSLSNLIEVVILI